MVELLKGAIVDVYPEGEISFRGCVLAGGINDISVIDLSTGNIKDVDYHEVDEPLLNIKNL